MSSPPFEALLDRAAALCGVEPEYWDIFGRRHVTTTEGKRAILRAMGWAAGSVEELEQSFAEHTRREWTRVAPPTVVAMEGEEIDLPLHVPAEELKDSIAITAQREDGSKDSFSFDASTLPQADSVEIDGRKWVRLRARLPIQLPAGYHEIFVKRADTEASTRYIVAPQKAWSQRALANGGRAAGIAVALYGLRSARNWGCGDFRDLWSVIDWAADDLRASFVGLNPLHAIHNRRPFNTSPYLPNCIFYQNFIYLDVEGIEEYALCGRTKRLRQSEEVVREIEELRAAEFVEYERVATLKLRFLWILFAQFLHECGKNAEYAREFDGFRQREGDLLRRFAIYCALDRYLHKCDPQLWLWTEWPAALQNPDSEETQAFAKEHESEVTFFQWIEWQIDRQLQAAQQKALERKLSIGLYHDLALATDRFGSDLWAHRPFFVGGCRVGAPPDDFAPQGQDWGFPPPNAQRHREDGYRLFAESIRKNCRHGGALRIDHVMRLFRLYWIPDGCSATEGAYVQETSADFVRVLALESMRNRVTIVGEDLGTVDPAIRETLSRFGILSYRLFFFEKNERGEFRDANEYPAQALVSSTTHDLPTLAGFWTGADIEARREAGVVNEAAWRDQWSLRNTEKQKMLDRLFAQGLLRADLPRLASDYPEWTGELHHAAIGFLAGTPSQLLAVNQEDITKEASQQNLPGTTWQYPNWGRKMRFTVEELRDNEEARSFAAMVRDWIINSGRENR